MEWTNPQARDAIGKNGNFEASMAQDFVGIGRTAANTVERAILVWKLSLQLCSNSSYNLCKCKQVKLMLDACLLGVNIINMKQKLEIFGVSKSFSGVKALSDVSLTIKPVKFMRLWEKTGREKYVNKNSCWSVKG